MRKCRYVHVVTPTRRHVVCIRLDLQGLWDENRLLSTTSALWFCLDQFKGWPAGRNYHAFTFPPAMKAICLLDITYMTMSTRVVQQQTIAALIPPVTRFHRYRRHVNAASEKDLNAPQLGVQLNENHFGLIKTKNQNRCSINPNDNKAFTTQNTSWWESMCSLVLMDWLSHSEIFRDSRSLYVSRQNKNSTRSEMFLQQQREIRAKQTAKRKGIKLIKIYLKIGKTLKGTYYNRTGLWAL